MRRESLSKKEHDKEPENERGHDDTDCHQRDPDDEDAGPKEVHEIGEQEKGTSDTEDQESKDYHHLSSFQEIRPVRDGRRSCAVYVSEYFTGT